MANVNHKRLQENINMTKEPLGQSSKLRSNRGGSLDESECGHIPHPQEPLLINFAAGATPIQHGHLQVRIGSLEAKPVRKHPVTEKKQSRFLEIDFKSGEVRIGLPGKRVSRGGAIIDQKGE